MMIATFGGGINSTAGIIELYRRGIVPDLIPFSDTGGERPETYAHIEAFSAWLVARGMPAVTVLRKTYQGNFEGLEGECLRSERLPSIAYGWKSCSQKYKAAPIEKFLNNWEPARACWRRKEKVKFAVFFDADEERRAKNFDDKKRVNWYPLIEWGIYREDCAEICASEGLKPGKSSCFFCPSMKKPEIIELQKLHPALADRALAMEQKAVPGLISVMGLGRYFNWGDFLASIKNQGVLFKDVDSVETPCGCYD